MNEKLISLLNEIGETRDKEALAILRAQATAEIIGIIPLVKESIDHYVQEELSGLGLAHFARVYINDQGEIVCQISFSEDVSQRPGFGHMSHDFQENFASSVAEILQVPLAYISTSIH